MKTHLRKIMVLALSCVAPLLLLASGPPVPPSFTPPPGFGPPGESGPPPPPPPPTSPDSPPSSSGPPSFTPPSGSSAVTPPPPPTSPDSSSSNSEPTSPPSSPNSPPSSSTPPSSDSSTVTPPPPPTSSDSPSSSSSTSSSSTTPEGKNVISGLGGKFEEMDKEIDQAVDTLNAKSGGNWLLKRVWWEKTEDVYEQIKEVFNHVMDTRMQFISERNKLDRELDIFYGEMGIEQGPLQDVLSHAQDLMDKDRKEQGYLNKKEQLFVKKLSGKERELEQLKLDVKAIQELDNKIDEALDTLFKQIDVCNQYEQKAWDNFKEIARELNDQEARKLYYDTQGLYKDIQKVQSYISGTFSSYFTQTIQSAHEHTTKISSQMNGLKSEGVDLVKEAEILEKDDNPPVKKAATKTTPKPVQKGWIAEMADWFTSIGSWFFNLLPKSVQAWFIKEEKTVEAAYDSAKKTVQHDYELTSDAIGKRVDDLHEEVQRAEHSVEDYFGYGSDDSKDSSDKKTTTDHPVHPSTPPFTPPSTPPTDTHSDASAADHHDVTPTFKPPSTTQKTTPVSSSTDKPSTPTPPVSTTKATEPGRSITNHLKPSTPISTPSDHADIPPVDHHDAAPTFKPPTHSVTPSDHTSAPPTPKPNVPTPGAGPSVPPPSGFHPPSFKPPK